MSKKNLKSLRKKIDKIDQELLLLIQQRAKHAVDIGNIKSKIFLAYIWGCAEPD